MEKNPYKKLSQGVSNAVSNFLVSTNFMHGGSINNETFEALYDFIKYAHRNNIKLSDSHFRDILLYEGAQPCDAEEISSIYLHCRNLLYKKKPWDDCQMYGWLKSKKEKEDRKAWYINNLRPS